jgi:hypothetical protein
MKTETTFLWQHPSIPFAFPNFGTRNIEGEHEITHPTKTTAALRLPWSRKQCEILKIECKAETKSEKKEKQAEVQMCLSVLNY